MRLLALDTSTEACSAALNIDGEIHARYQLAPREHSRLILRMIDELLADAGLSLADLDAVAFGRGPGSFMGLRIAAGVTQGIAFANDTPVVPVSTLMAIAHVAASRCGSNQVLAAIDARMDEVYWAAYRYQHGRWSVQGEEMVVAPESVSFPGNPGDSEWVAAGTGWASYGERLLADGRIHPLERIDDCFPTAEAISQLALVEMEQGNACRAAQAVPVYLRNDVARKPKPVRL